MRFVTVRDLRNKPAELRLRLRKEKELVLTSNGKPFAVVSATSEEGLERSLALMRRMRAEMAVTSMQRRSMEQGTDRLGLGEIEAEIAAVRRKRA